MARAPGSEKSRGPWPATCEDAGSGSSTMLCELSQLGTAECESSNNFQTLFLHFSCLHAMGKGKGAAGVPNRHIYTRASYLYQAATYLASRVPDARDGAPQQEPASGKDPKAEDSTLASTEEQRKAIQNVSRHALQDMRAVSLKVLIRQTPALKRTICKFCDTLQVEGKTCRSVVENTSRGGRKPWADVLAVECRTCGHTKRYPVSASRQKRRPLRDRQQEPQEPTESIREEETSTPAT